MPFNQTRLIDTIKAVRELADAKALKIMIGGFAANAFPDLWQRVGADGYARDAEQAVRMASQLLAEAEISQK
jgi:methanogenic corrinoid protein MtbC1